MKRSLRMVICGLVLVTAVGVAFAGFSKPEDAIRYRKAVMTVIANHFGNLATVIKGKSPFEKMEVAHNASVIKTMAELPWDAMMYPGSDKGDTTLTASAMQEKEKFMGLAHEFETATQNLVGAAESGDMGAFKAQFGEVAGFCKTCHSTYRKK